MRSLQDSQNEQLNRYQTLQEQLSTLTQQYEARTQPDETLVQESQNTQLNRYQTLQEQLSTLTQQYEARTQPDDALAQQVRSLQESQNIQLNRYQTLQEQLLTLTQQYEARTQPDETLVQQVRSLQEMQRSQGEQLATLTQTTQTLQQQLASPEYQRLKEQLFALAQQLVQYENHTEAAILSTQEQLTQYETLAEEAILSTQQQVEALQPSIHQIHGVQATVENFTQRLSQLEGHYAELEQQIQQARENIQTAIAQLNTTPPSQSPEPIVPVEEPPPKTESFDAQLPVNYHQLRDLLAAGLWQQADLETKALMLQACDQPQASKLSTDRIAQFPCKTLWTIDRLWVYYSQGRFGFSVQKQIYDAVGQNYDRFGDRLQWKVNQNWKNYADLNFSPQAPLGHLPLGALITDTSLGWFGFEWAALLTRLDSCQNDPKKH
ncbi:MAG: GUN4 domain-containing protein [Cyanobacteria bacterium FC1]|nr:GUN4 domain-containing protein [Cyanobacteria bacterium FC1]